jgi:hypothetical protein
MIDVDDIKSALDDAATALREQADLLDEARGLIDDDTVQNEYRDAFVEALTEDVDAVEASGPNERESEDHHEGWLEGYRAAIDFLNDNY